MVSKGTRRRRGRRVALAFDRRLELARTAVASGPHVAENTLYSIDEDETNELQCKPTPYASFASVHPNVPLMMELYDEFVKLIETGSSGLATFEDGLDIQRVLAQIGYSVPT